MPVVDAQSVSYAYGTERVLDSVDLSVSAGEFVALVGPNGSGKTTLLRCLLGLARPTAGRVRLFDSEPARMRDRWRIGFVPQRARLAPDLPARVDEVVAAGRLARQGWWRPIGAKDRAAVQHALDAVGVAELRRRRFTQLSGGQQQRVLIAKALASDPELLVLDEPVAGVDSESQHLFRQSLVHLVRDHRAAVLLVSHELGAVADDLDRVVVLKRRVLFDGPPDQLSATGVSLGVHGHDLPVWLERLA